MTNILISHISEGQEPGNGSSGWFWLRQSHEVVVKPTARVTVGRARRPAFPSICVAVVGRKP